MTITSEPVALSVPSFGVGLPHPWPVSLPTPVVMGPVSAEAPLNRLNPLDCVGVSALGDKRGRQ